MMTPNEKFKEYAQAGAKNDGAEEVATVERTLKKARKYNLEAEVMWSAMRHYSLRGDMEESCEKGLKIWDLWD